MEINFSGLSGYSKEILEAAKQATTNKKTDDEKKSEF